MEQIAYPRHPGFTPSALILATTVSIVLHLLLLWLLTRYDSLEQFTTPNSSLQRPLRIIIAPSKKNQDMAHQYHPQFEATTGQDQKRKPIADKAHDDVIKRNTHSEYTPAPDRVPKQPNTGRINDTTPTTAQIRKSATAVARDMANTNTGEVKKETDSITAILNRALNNPRKTPGIYSQSDGTTRIVTKSGFTYCIKALEDWRIIDPGDDMQVSVYCE